MADPIQGLMAEARAMDLFRPHAAFEVHCSNCHSRLVGAGDCPSCGIIGRSEEEVAKRAAADPAGTERLLRAQMALRRAFKPVKAGGREA